MTGVEGRAGTDTAHPERQVSATADIRRAELERLHAVFCCRSTAAVNDSTWPTPAAWGPGTTDSSLGQSARRSRKGGTGGRCRRRKPASWAFNFAAHREWIDRSAKVARTELGRMGRKCGPCGPKGQGPHTGGP